MTFPSYYRAVEATVENILAEASSLERPCIVGINGIDGVGKTHFADALETSLTAQHKPVVIVHVDDFTNPSSIRHAGTTQVENYYSHTFDLTSLRERIIEPVRQGMLFSVDMVHSAPQDDDKTVRHSYHIHDPESIILIEGVFIYRPELVQAFDYRIFLSMPLAAMLGRGGQRDAVRLGQNVLTNYTKKYIPAQQRYLELVRPAEIAHQVIDLTDWGNPRIVTTKGSQI